MVTGVTSVSINYGGGRWSTTQSSYGGPNDAVESSKDAQAHRGADGLLGDVEG
jgi:hypothetical protein